MRNLTVGASARYDRQIAAFGSATQSLLAQATAAVVGVGGVGSFVVQALAHLGVGRLMLVDPDIVEPSNLNRLVGAYPADATSSTAKVDVAARMIRHINPDVRVDTVHGSVLDVDVWAWLRAADMIIGAVDGHAPRWAMNWLAVQYARWYADIGVELRPTPATADSVTRLEAGGHVAIVRPNGPCLLCLSGYDPRLVSRELDPDLATATRAAGYRTDAPTEPTPSIIFANQVTAGHAVAELLNWLSPWRAPTPYMLIDLTANTSLSLHAERHEHCPACGPGSPRALGDTAGTPDLTPTQGGPMTTMPFTPSASST